MADFYGGDTAAEDYQEEEIWGMMAKATESSSSKIRKNFSISTRNFTTTPRAIPRSNTSCGGASSAPLAIPEWSKILKKKKPKKNKWDDDACNDDNDVCCRENEGDDEDENERVPPHEYLARRLASTQIASFSMCEGVGRTLKGRDLSNLRNAILMKTGFLEQR